MRFAYFYDNGRASDDRRASIGWTGFYGMTGQRTERPTTLGVVGGVASGKSFATAEFVAQGAAKFDADLEVCALYEDSSVLETIRRRWPSAVKEDGKLNRQELARIVFAPNEKGRNELATLNSIVHPLLFEIFERWLKGLHGKEFAVVDAPLLFEVGWQKRVDYVVFVDADYETRLKRALDRGWSPEELAFREARQFPLDVKKNQSDFIIESRRDGPAVSVQVASILSQIREKQYLMSQR